MADAITWKTVTKEHVARLAQCHSVEDCRREIAEIFRMDARDDRNVFLVDLFLHSYSFARQNHFLDEQCSVFLGILQHLVELDFMGTSTSTMESSYRQFQSLLLLHSVERSPKSVCIFSPADVNNVVDFVAHNYYRHFHLYKCIFTPFIHTHIVQKSVSGIQLPPRPRPLSAAFMHPHENFGSQNEELASEDQTN